jgi:hypothetical protein
VTEHWDLLAAFNHLLVAGHTLPGSRGARISRF